MFFFRPKEDLRHRRLVNAANALARDRQPSKLQLQRLAEIWVEAGLAVGRVSFGIYVHDNPPGDAHGWIQWKGTDACVDLHCACGSHGHFDGWFMYRVKCNDCGRKYVVGCNVKLIEVTPETEELAASSAGGGDEYLPFSDDD